MHISPALHQTSIDMEKHLKTLLAETRTESVEPNVTQQTGGELERNFRFLDALGMAFAMLNSWTAMAAS
jgi:hypothetical protein